MAMNSLRASLPCRSKYYNKHLNLEGRF